MAHPDNAYYGHKRLLAEYAGMGASPPPIRGHVQHGWSPSDGVSERARLVSWLPKLVWNDVNRKAADEAGVGPVETIGAPFCYYDRVAPPPPAHSPQATIYYPFHSWERADYLGSHHELVAAIDDHERGPVTVCLYWREFDQVVVRRIYESAGFRVVCHGRRADPYFTIRQREELLLHDRVASNRVATALWYGGYLGRCMAVYGPVFSIESQGEAAGFDCYQRSRWPALFEGRLDSESSRQLAAYELGDGFVMAPDELREVLGWTPKRVRVAGLVRAASYAEHHVRRVGVNLAARLPRR